MQILNNRLKKLTYINLNLYYIFLKKYFSITIVFTLARKRFESVLNEGRKRLMVI